MFDTRVEVKTRLTLCYILKHILTNGSNFARKGIRMFDLSKKEYKDEVVRREHDE